jgi:hypothetical protein
MLHVFFGLANSYPAMMKHHDHILIDSWIPHHPFGSHWPIVPSSLYSLPIILKEKKTKKIPNGNGDSSILWMEEILHHLWLNPYK